MLHLLRRQAFELKVYSKELLESIENRNVRLVRLANFT
jgi:hypothetical protein